MIEHIFIAVLCKGHILLEGVPGLGKTLIIKTIADILDLDFSRIQFTPDLMPSDITGSEIITQEAKTGDRGFKFIKGPIFSNIILADEINRSPAKVQSALLEAMDERQVTVEGVTHELPRPFTVMATQNPIEYEGTFPLPEAQLDRFLITINLGYPSVEQELSIINNQETVHPIESLGQVLSSDDILSIQEAVKTVYVDDLIREYIVGLVDKSRNHTEAALGASPRGSLALFRGTQALALIRGRDFVLPDDVKELAVPMLSHRIIVSPAGRMRGIQSTDIVEELIEQIAVPGAQTSGWFRT